MLTDDWAVVIKTWEASCHDYVYNRSRTYIRPVCTELSTGVVRLIYSAYIYLA